MDARRCPKKASLAPGGLRTRFSTTAMWVYRLGAEKAKQMLFTGDLISGK